MLLFFCVRLCDQVKQKAGILLPLFELKGWNFVMPFEQSFFSCLVE
jgi:hypothetical protein